MQQGRRVADPPRRLSSRSLRLLSVGALLLALGSLLNAGGQVFGLLGQHDELDQSAGPGLSTVRYFFTQGTFLLAAALLAACGWGVAFVFLRGLARERGWEEQEEEDEADWQDGEAGDDDDGDEEADAYEGAPDLTVVVRTPPLRRTGDPLDGDILGR